MQLLYKSLFGVLSLKTCSQTQMTHFRGHLSFIYPQIQHTVAKMIWEIQIIFWDSADCQSYTVWQIYLVQLLGSL